MQALVLSHLFGQYWLAMLDIHLSVSVSSTALFKLCWQLLRIN